MKLKITKPWVRNVVSLLIALSLSFAFAITLIFLLSDTPVESIKIFLSGPGTKINRIGDWIEETITLIFIGLSVAVLFQGQIFSMLTPGNMIIASMCGSLVMLFSTLPPGITITLGVLAGVTASTLLSGLVGWLHNKYKIDLVVSTLMLNIILGQMNILLILEKLRVVDLVALGSRFFDPWLKIPSAVNPNWGPFFEKFSKATSVSIFLYIAILLCIIIYFVIYYTKFGYKLRMVGENRDFANYGGINVKDISIKTMMLSGMLAGFGGVHLTFAQHTQLIADPTSGFGFGGFLVATIAYNNPLLIPLSSLFYGYLRIGADIMERTSDLSREMVMLLQGVIMLLVSANGIIKTVTARAKTDDDNEDDTEPKRKFSLKSIRKEGQ